MSIDSEVSSSSAHLTSEVLARIKPSESEERQILNAVKALKEKVSRTPSFKEEKIELCLVGSIARGTHLKDPDIDLFLLFEPAVPRKRLEILGVRIGKEAIDGKEHYAEHPYIRGTFQGLKTDVVPAYKIADASQKMTAVDRTPFHKEFIVNNLAEEQKDEVRLLKRFMKGVGAYGAEIKTEGFSGYLCELLIIKYGSFKGVLKDAARWSRSEVIVLDDEKAKKFDNPLVFIDPVDKNRNVASPVSVDTISQFMHAARNYISAPSMKFFFPEAPITSAKEDLAGLMTHRGDVIALSLPKPDIIDDILYGQVKKFERNIVNLLETKDFQVMHNSHHVDDSDILLYIELGHRVLSSSMVHRGPPVWVQENAKDFIDKWKDNPDALSKPYLENGKWQVIVKRKYEDAVEMLADNIAGLDIGKDLNSLKESLKITHGDELFSEELIAGLSEFLDKRMPWDV